MMSQTCCKFVILNLVWLILWSRLRAFNPSLKQSIPFLHNTDFTAKHKLANVSKTNDISFDKPSTDYTYIKKRITISYIILWGSLNPFESTYILFFTTCINCYPNFSSYLLEFHVKLFRHLTFYETKKLPLNANEYLINKLQRYDYIWLKNNLVTNSR